jgi:nitrate/TMAO reductase-like tetraheme cytochrome c subunit
MDIFAEMKKFSLTIFASLVVLIAFINAGNSEAIRHVENTDTFCASSNSSQTDFERSHSYSIHSAWNNCRHHAATSDLHSSATFRITGLAYSACLAEEQGEPRVKQYLQEIYPSHNFW